MFIFVGMDTIIRVQILNMAACFSQCANNLGEGMNPTILSPAMGK